MLADEVDYVVGVDTHRDEHVLGGRERAVRCGAGRCANAAATEALRFAGEAAVGAASGRSRAPAATAPASPVTWRPRRDGARDQPHAASRAALRGKDDSLDAARRRAALASETLALPRAGRRREALRLLLVARRSAVDVRREALVQLRRDRDRPRPSPRGAASAAARAAHAAAASAARARAHPTSRRGRLVLRRSPAHPGSDRGSRRARTRDPRPRPRARTQLLDEPGVGPIVAAQLIVAWSHHGRVRSEAAFADSPASPRSPPQRPDDPPPLSRGGDRQLNRALHTVVLHRRQHDPAPRTTSPPRRRRQNPRDATRCSSATSPATSTASCRKQTPLMT